MEVATFFEMKEGCNNNYLIIIAWLRAVKEGATHNFFIFLKLVLNMMLN